MRVMDIHDNQEFLRRMNTLQAKAGISRIKACKMLPISEGRLSDIRNNRASPSPKFWVRLESAERKVYQGNADAYFRGFVKATLGINERPSNQAIAQQTGLPIDLVDDCLNRRIPTSGHRLFSLKAFIDSDSHSAHSISNRMDDIQNELRIDFCRRIKVLMKKLRLRRVDDAATVTGISIRMLYGYRSGRYPITTRALAKLEAAEKSIPAEQFPTDNTCIFSTQSPAGPLFDLVISKLDVAELEALHEKIWAALKERMRGQS